MHALTFEPNEPQWTKRATAAESIHIGRARGCQSPRPEHETRAKWKDSCSATRRCAGFEKPAAIKTGSSGSLSIRTGTGESPAKSRRSSGKPRPSEPGAGNLLPWRGVRARPRQHSQGDVRALRHGSRAARGGWERQAASGLTRREHDPAGGHVVPLRGQAGASEARLWRQRSGSESLRHRAGGQPSRSSDSGRPSSSKSRATRFERSPRSSASPSRKPTATSRLFFPTPRKKHRLWQSWLGRSRSSRSTGPSSPSRPRSRRATPPPSSPSAGSTSGARSCCTSRRSRSSTPGRMAHPSQSTIEGR